MMEESHRKVLQKLRLKISRNINVRRVTESLFSGGILDENDREEIFAETTTEYKALRLLNLLPRKGSQAFPEFLKALRCSGSGSGSGLANAIQLELSGEEPAGESNERRPKSVGLPSKVPKFVGRMNVCDEITHLLASDKGDDTACLVTIVASPGFGKTTVATNIGYRMLEEGKDVLHFSLRNVCSLNRAAEYMLEKLVGIYAGENPVKQLTSYLSSLPHQTVLILDNAEDLQIGDGSNFEDFLEEIGQHALNVVTIITSRNAVSKLDLFSFPTKHIPLKPLTGEDSAAYLKNHVPGLSDHLVRAFAKACRGVPLLLTITGSFLKKKTIDPIDLHRKLQNCPHSFLKAKDAKIQELYSLLRVFYNNLGPDMKKYLAYLASFPTSFTKEEAKDVLFPNEDYFDFQLVLDNLEQHSLVQQDEDQNKQYYSLHPLVQAFCKSSRKDTCTRYNTAIRLFSKHYLSLLQRMNSDFISTDCKTVIDEYHERKSNISHAILASTEDDDNDLKQFGLRVSTEAVNLLAKVMKLDEFMSLYSQCLRVAKGMADETLYSECLVAIGFKQLCYYGYKDAYRTDAKRSLQEAHDLQTRLVNYDSECKGHCKCKLGLCCFVAGDRKKGISLIAQGIGMRKRLVHSEGSGKMERMLLADGFCDLAMAMFTSGKYKAAVNIWTNLCLVRYRELLGTHPFTASLLHYIGDAYQKLGDPKRAVAFKKESLAMRRSLLGVEHLDTARAHYGVGCALGALGSTEGALEHLSRAYEIQKRFHASKYDIEKTEQEINWFTSKNKSRVRTFCFLSWYRGECLGAGRFGKVFRCITWNDEIFAVKIVKMKPQYSETQEEVKALQNEISILKKLTHERIVSYHGSEQKDGHLHLFMDFMAGGSLSAYIKKSGVLSEDESRWYTNQMLQGIEFLHLLDVIHRDIKGSNVLLDGKGNVKLADFGSSKMIQKVGTKTNLESYCGTPYWMAPEILWGEGYGRKADIWSLGCTVVEMLTGKPPLGDMEPVAAIFKIGSQPTEPTLPETASQDAKDFIKAALAWKPEERPWSGDLQRYKFVSKRR